jgi:hypothetical protein
MYSRPQLSTLLTGLREALKKELPPWNVIKVVQQLDCLVGELFATT